MAMAKALIRGRLLVWNAAAEPRTDAALLVEDGTIAAVGDDALRMAGGHTRLLDFPEQVIAPGLIDSHVHLMWSGAGVVNGRDPMYAALGQPPAALTAQAVSNLHAALSRGITTVRDCGGLAEVIIPLARAARDGMLVAPRIVAAGAPITPPGGHCWFLENEAQGAAAARRAVRRMHRAGADFIKVMATGGGTRGTNPRAAQYGPGELQAIAHAAHGVGLRVTAHAHGSEGIERCVAAGYDGLEHCTWLARDRDGEDYRPALVEQIRARRIFVCKTIAGFERWPLEELQAAGERHPAWAGFATFRAMVAAGVAVIAGTDAGIVDTNFVDLARTMETMVGLGGMAPAAVLRSATATAAEALALERHIGTLEVGKRADCIVLDGNPRADVRALRQVRAVIRDGVVVARDGVVVAESPGRPAPGR